jgi:hypothetical protein
VLKWLSAYRTQVRHRCLVYTPCWQLIIADTVCDGYVLVCHAVSTWHQGALIDSCSTV